MLHQNNGLLKFNHYFHQNRMEKKGVGYKIKEHKENGNDSERDGNQQITRTNKTPRKRQKTISDSCQLEFIGDL